MNILYLDHYAGSIQYGRSFRPYYLGKEWVKDGHEITVVGGTYSHLRQQQPISSGTEIVEKIKYIWLKTPPYHGNGVKRAISMICFMLQVFIHMRLILGESNPDVIIGSSVHMLDMFPAWVMKKISKKKIRLIFELHDLWPLTPMELSGMKRWHPFVIMISISEWWTYKVADRVVSILPKTYEYMKRFKIKPEQFFYVPNGVVIEDWSNADNLAQTHQEIIFKLKKQGYFLIGYTGAHGLSNALDVLLEASAILSKQHEKIAFILVGHGPNKEKLKNLAEEKKLKDVFFFDGIAKSVIPTFNSSMNALYIGLQKRPLFQYGISPNKIFDYMMSGRPIIQSITAGNDFIYDANCGITIEAENVQELVKACITLKNKSKEELDFLGSNGKKYVEEHHNYEILAKKYIQALQ